MDDRIKANRVAQSNLPTDGEIASSIATTTLQIMALGRKKMIEMLPPQARPMATQNKDLTDQGLAMAIAGYLYREAFNLAPLIKATLKTQIDPTDASRVADDYLSGIGI